MLERTLILARMFLCRERYSKCRRIEQEREHMYFVIPLIPLTPPTREVTSMYVRNRDGNLEPGKSFKINAFGSHSVNAR